MADWGWGFSATELRDLIQDYVKANKMDTQFLDGLPGSDWMANFLQRHPEISRRTTEHLSRGRKEAEDPEILAHWFALLDEILTKAGVKDHPHQIFNADESGFVTDPKSDIVLARRGARRVNQTIGGSGKEQITVNCAGSAADNALPPYIVYKGKNLYRDWVQGAPAGSLFNTSLNGWMESEHFFEWFKEQFLTNTQELSNLSRILIFDGHLSHLSVEIVKCARKNNVVLLRLPAKLTHLLQPFDKTVFRPVKQQWQRLLKQHARTHRGPVSKAMFPKLLKELYETSFSADVIQSGFRSTGICPFNPNAVKLDLNNPVPSTGDIAVLGPANSTSVEPRPSTVSAESHPSSSTSTAPPSTASAESHPSTSSTPTAANLQTSSAAADSGPSSSTEANQPTLKAANRPPSTLGTPTPSSASQYSSDPTDVRPIPAKKETRQSLAEKRHYWRMSKRGQRAEKTKEELSAIYKKDNDKRRDRRCAAVTKIVPNLPTTSEFAPALAPSCAVSLPLTIDAAPTPPLTTVATPIPPPTSEAAPTPPPILQFPTSGHSSTLISGVDNTPAPCSPSPTKDSKYSSLKRVKKSLPN
ncbi:pogo transposable element with krab domain [Plakobranchus ocellatus]|uniref:Pogo transposable element with krab domain n=1 Tax=Plakobranchus ocellatus TaxID=259542 RepID=A0AAV4B071_9GAST|nr:pogo transposable element with krab domain [Plakobranchus ocellatus]